MSSYAVVAEDVEFDITFEGDVVGVILSTPEGEEQLSVDLSLAEAGALRDWLVKVLPS